MTYFLDIRQKSSGQLRLAVFEISGKSRIGTLLPFTELFPNTSVIELVDELNTLRNKTIVEHEDNYISEFWSINGRAETKNLTLVITTNPYVFSDFFDDIIYKLNALDVDILFLTSNKKSISQQSNIQWYYKSVIYINELDELNDKLLVYFKICGRCPQGWEQFDHQHYATSCYKVIQTNDQVSAFEAEEICSGHKSKLVNLESRNEVKFIQNVLSAFQTKFEKPKRKIPIGLQYSIKSQPFRYQWSNERPFMLGNYNVAQKFKARKFPSCVAMSVVKDRNRINNIRNMLFDHDCNLRSFNVFICEHDLVRNWTGFDVLNIDESTNSKKKVYLARDFFFDCQEDDRFVTYFEVCNGIPECSSGLDEEFCSVHKHTKMKSRYYNDLKNKFLIGPGLFSLEKASSDISNECSEKICQGGYCLPSQWFSDRECLVTFNEKRDIICFDKQCTNIIKFVFCDARSEEIQMKTHRSQSDSSRFPVVKHLKGAPKCIYLRSRSGYPIGCHYLSHLENCENFICPDDMVKCPLSYCIQVHYVGDGIMDCRYGEDEAYLVHVGNADLKYCMSKAETGEIIHFCDGEIDCENVVDENNCPMICPDNFNCQLRVIFFDGRQNNNKLDSIIAVDRFTTVLKISNVDLSGTLFKFLGDGTSLIFEFNAFNCNIQSDDLLHRGFSEPLHFNNAYKVDLSYNNISSLKTNGFLYLFHNLKLLNLSNNRNLKFVEENSIRSNVLRVIDFSFTKISSLPSHIFESRSLQLVNLSNTHMMSLGWIFQNMKLKILDLTNTQLDEQLLSTNEFKDIKVTDNLLTDNYKLCCALILGPNTSPDVCHSPRDAISSCDDLLADKTKRVLLWIVASVSFIGNVVVLSYRYLIDRDILKLSYGVFIINLGISDFIMSMYLIIISAVDTYYRDVYVLYEHQWRYSPLCKAAGFLSTLSSETSTFFVLLVTIDRFLAIRFPLRNYRFSKPYVILSVFLVWTVGCVIALIPVLSPDVAIYSSNGMCLGLPLYYNQESGWTYAMCIFIILNFIMFTLVAAGQAAIYITATMCNKILVHSQPRKEKDVDVARRLCHIAMSNFLCWFPPYQATTVPLTLANMAGKINYALQLARPAYCEY
ncbi:hypothetical protein Btru_059750 [Bulinus truncatus]|nr:hypothetical protein Btru_059750 [Bulinus truncatus]